MTRWVRFIISIGIGIGLGLLYGWVINPVDYVDTPPESLRIDFKGDYILMVAEVYYENGDLGLASQALKFLGQESNEEMVLEAIKFAEKEGYLDSDVELMRKLLKDLQILSSELEVSSP